MNFNGFGKATKEMINKFEQHIGFSLPDDYKKFLIEYNGGIPQIKYCNFFVKELNAYIPLDVLYGIDIKKMDLLRWFDEYNEDLFSNSIIIGKDPGGGMIVLLNDNKGEAVYYWDHSYLFEQSNDGKNSYKVADDFGTFIDGLKNP